MASSSQEPARAEHACASAGPERRGAFRRTTVWLLIVLCMGGSSVSGETAREVAARVVIVANASNPESTELARHYASRREVPLENIVALPLSSDETISWPTFVTELQRPLQDELLRRGWIDGVAMDLVDEAGRRKVAVSGHRISYLVVCRGVPLTIAHDPALVKGPAGPVDRREFRTNAAAVDSELSLLAWTRPPLNGWVPNPLFSAGVGGLWENPVLKVARLDAPTLGQAIALVEGALAAERNGLSGPAVFDLGGPEPAGDRWLGQALAIAQELGFEVREERTSATFAAGAEVAGAALYFGWYTPEVNGPFAEPGYRFAPGAIALHIHSMSARSLRRENDSGWVAALVAKGAAAVFGNVDEPYLELTHRPDLLLRSLARGDTMGDAAYHALPALGWMSIFVGDPLYRPFRAR